MKGEGFTRRRGGAEGGRYKGTGNLAGLAGLARTHFGAGEENRAKDAKVRGMKDNEIGRVVVEGAFALRIQMPSGSGMCQIGRVVVGPHR